ncbi:MAG: methyltransferase domain-containing protein [Lachnospiraceae bacterium]|nr:methyltransferase domain-containing protein [Lachnospiraceae bacterium]
MHNSSWLRMEWFVNTYLLPINLKMKKIISVLDIGSQDVNGSYRNLFPSSQFLYTGLDMVMGKNVDYVPRKQYNWDEIRDNSYDVIISGQCLEHVEFPWVIFAEMCRILKEDGLLCLITPRLQNRHRYPVDTYRYDIDGMAALVKFGNLIPEHISMNEAPVNAPISWFSELGDCLLIARKPKNWPGMLDINNYSYIAWPIDNLKSGFVSENNHPGIIRKHLDVLQNKLLQTNK